MCQWAPGMVSATACDLVSLRHSHLSCIDTRLASSVPAWREGAHGSPGSQDRCPGRQSVSHCTPSISGSRPGAWHSWSSWSLSLFSRPFHVGDRPLSPQYSSLEAKLCQVESKYLILLQEMQTPVCVEEQGPAREVIAQLLADALQVEGPEQPEQALVKPRLVRSGDPRLWGQAVGTDSGDS